MVYDKKDIILSNLSRIGKEQTELLEKQFAHLGELASLLCEEAGEEEIFFRDPGFAASYAELMKNVKTVIPEAAVSINTEKTSVVNTSLSAFSRRLSAAGLQTASVSGGYRRREHISRISAPTETRPYRICRTPMPTRHIPVFQIL